ncbi:hypothetical protein IQ03_04986 [Gemmobacter caeni]|jgi:hypothetical protein|uniref:Uncharacterized protein n=1 Tax=Gemmobacter caeni TaxID=589035 RepID=A0A2T6ABW0_9RHOB|nr:hypothetical protein C8N34_1301 [Gemmobacter caeni]TWI89964.1 hypothetical protein IQ03_04986 [Gemmobacter caeni]
MMDTSGSVMRGWRVCGGAYDQQVADVGFTILLTDPSRVLPPADLRGGT